MGPSSSNLVVEPQTQAFAGYAGSASCRECHEEAYADWASSNHGLAERQVNLTADQSAFQTTKPMSDDLPDTSVGIRERRLFVATPGLTGRRETNFIERVIGNDPVRQFLVPFPDGRLQTLEASWDIRQRDWFDSYGREHRRPGEWGHWTGRGMNWNSMCAACHNTRLRKNYDEVTDTYQTAMAEMTVGCESCHGPLKAHNDWQKRFGKSGKPDPTVLRLSQRQMLETCGQCHSRRAELTGDFKPGDDFQDHFDLDTVDGSDNYYPDGQVREEDYEYAAFLGSRMHAAGVTCVNCHNPHTAKVRLPGNWVCLQCHAGGHPNAPFIDPVAHSHHKVRGYGADGELVESDLNKFSSKNFSETGGECVNCHMPQTVYMQRHWRHDHGFTIPDPLLTKQFGIPNACNRCHQNKSVDWALEATEKWYGNRMERPTRQRAQTFARARAGDATAVEPLLQLLAGNETSYWKAAAINLLEPWAGVPSVQTALLASLNHSNALVRTKAIRMLETSTTQPTVEIENALPAKLTDETRSVRVAAAWALRGSLELTNPAARELEWSLNQNADQPIGQLQKGAFFVARNDLPNALEHYRKAAAWDMNSAPIRHDLAIIYGMLNRNRDALEQLQEAVRLDPNEAEYHYKLALAWHEVGNLRATISELENAVRLNPHHARAWYNLGLAFDADHNADRALKSLDQAEVIDSADPEIPYARAAILLRQGRPVEGRAGAR
jgi:tetratricopeptide (TPR) repeat protein